MLSRKGSLLCLGAAALCAAAGARAQESNAVIGPPQLRDFQLDGRRQVTQPAPQPQPQSRPTSPSTAAAPPRQAPTQARPAQRPAETAEAPRRDAAPAPAEGAPPTTLEPAADSTAAPMAPIPAPSPVVRPAAPEAGGASWWFYALPAAALALLGVALVRRRRRSEEEPRPESEAAPVAAPPPAPRPDPVPRPWLELALKAERAAFTDTEAELLFELEISNKGGSAARNLRIDVKLFNGGIDQQDKEIGAFFRTAGRETTKLTLPEVEAGVVGVIQGRVTLAREEMRAMKLDERLLFVPVVAVNALYDWGQGRTGQTSKSYIVGRERQQPGEKMGAFRVDQGPRVWRSVGQRPHTLAKRV